MNALKLFSCLFLFGFGGLFVKEVYAQYPRYPDEWRTPPKKSTHPNSRYSKQNKEKEPIEIYFPRNEITLNLGNAFVNEVQLTYGRAITADQLHQLTFSAGWVRRMPFGMIKELERYGFEFFATAPSWVYCSGLSLALGYSNAKKDKSWYWNVQLFYRNLGYSNQETFIRPSDSRRDYDYYQIREDLERHVLGGKFLFYYPLTNSPVFRCSFFWGAGLRVKFDTHNIKSVYNQDRPSKLEDIRKKYGYEEIWMPSIHVGLQIGFGW